VPITACSKVNSAPAATPVVLEGCFCPESLYCSFLLRANFDRATLYYRIAVYALSLCLCYKLTSYVRHISRPNELAAANIGVKLMSFHPSSCLVAHLSSDSRHYHFRSLLSSLYFFPLLSTNQSFLTAELWLRYLMLQS